MNKIIKENMNQMDLIELIDLKNHIESILFAYVKEFRKKQL